MSVKLIRELVRQILSEGIYDPGVLKAVFMAGGPGSGKSYTAKAVFGGETAETAALQASTSMGLRLVNSDPAFEMFLKKAGVDPKTLGDISKEEFEALTDDDDPNSPRSKGKSLRNRQRDFLEAGRVGMVIDGTGDNYDKIAAKKAMLEDLGYDTFMIFVNTTLDMAQERNAKRDRVLPEKLVEDIWTDVQSNLGGFQTLFGSNFRIIDNTEYDWGPAEEDAVSAARAFVESPLQNPIGRAWAEDQFGEKERTHGPEDAERKAPGQRSRLLGDEEDADTAPRSRSERGNWRR
jgi:predicted kinase